jgi:hypothetical protein
VVGSIPTDYTMNKDELYVKFMMLFFDELREKLSCAGCNDFVLKEFISSKEDRVAFIKEIEPDYFDYSHRAECDIVSDTSILKWVISEFKKRTL